MGYNTTYHRGITHYRWHGYKMMFNGLPVLSVVLVCSIVFFGCVAPDTFPECEVLLQKVETVKKACFLDTDVKDYFKQADRYCPDWEDLSTLKSIEMVVAQRACKMRCSSESKIRKNGETLYSSCGLLPRASR